MLHRALQRLFFFLCAASPGVTAAFPDCSDGPLAANRVCDTSLTPLARAQALVAALTVDEKITNLVHNASGVARLGLPAFNWWGEALHGVARSPAVSFAGPGQDFSSATSFPQPIVLGAAFDDDLVRAVAAVVSTEARAFSNGDHAGLSFWTPNINPFRDPRWGRGQETPGEDPLHLQRYVRSLLAGLQDADDGAGFRKIAPCCKHYAAYDLEGAEPLTRHEFDAVVSAQDLSDYFLPPFETCAVESNVASVMCSYNAVNGVPSCANSFLLDDVLRGHWGWDDVDQWIVSDCGAVEDIYENHHYGASPQAGAAAALKAGTDLECGSYWLQHLPTALNESLVAEADLDAALTRLYASLVRLGYFDPAAAQPLRQLGWDAVDTPSARALARRAAVAGAVLIANDGVLPLQAPSAAAANGTRALSVALVGPFANATTQMQGNYYGVAPYLVSPLQAAQGIQGVDVTYAFGANVTAAHPSAADAVAAAAQADVVVFAGGIDNTVESEGLDREGGIAWPAPQLDLLRQIRAAAPRGKVVVLQFGGGQVDDTPLLLAAGNSSASSSSSSSSSSNSSSPLANAILWLGYPGQEGGNAAWDLLLGAAAPAGRLPVTQYPAAYADRVSIYDMGLRPSTANNSGLGRTYMWYDGEAPPAAFGTGLHYTAFALDWARAPGGNTSSSSTFSVQDLVGTGGTGAWREVKKKVFATLGVEVRNEGAVTSDFVAMVFLNGTGGPEPRPRSRLVGYGRAHDVAKGGGAQVVQVEVSVGALLRADETGDRVLYPGSYSLVVDAAGLLRWDFEITGEAAVVEEFPRGG